MKKITLLSIVAVLMLASCGSPSPAPVVNADSVKVAVDTAKAVVDTVKK